MSRRTKWIVWIVVIGALLAVKLAVSPTDEILYERLERLYGS